ncbi:hypothetical protein PS732_02501 [Pseudomonas fluorescens]|uniref:Uncharacterized protein n=1 Tax=Pseudomonas fluorescens TaxID=294 RepID=A0ABD7VFG3_PSEFL|nr:hypothetical protein PS732_02501 [Pseudomonas fluorescens]
MKTWFPVVTRVASKLVCVAYYSFKLYASLHGS